MAKNRAKVTRRKIMQAKVEATTGTEETLASGDYLEAFDPSMPFDDTFNQRTGVGLGQRQGAAGAQTASPKFTTELRNAATLPLCLSLLTAAGLKNTSGVFAPQTSADVGDTATIGLNTDGIYKSCYGAMFDVTMTGEVGKPVMMEWSGKGKRATGVAGPRDVTPIAATPLSGPPPIVKGIVATIGATSYCFSKFVFAFGNDVQLRPCATDATGYLAAQIVGRDPTLTIDPEMRSVAAKDFYADYEAGTQVAISIQIGSGEDGTITIAAGKAQLRQSPADEDGSGIARFGLTFQLNETAGDDEFTITAA